MYIEMVVHSLCTSEKTIVLIDLTCMLETHVFSSHGGKMSSFICAVLNINVREAQVRFFDIG